MVHYNATNAARFPWVALSVHPNGRDPIIYSDKVALLHRGATAACDAIDGLKDGVIDDPRKCKYDPVVLLCKAGQDEAQNQCLNAAQVEAVRRIYAKPQTRDGKTYFGYGTEFGTEHDWARSILPVRGSPDPAFMLVGAETGLKYFVTRNNPGPHYDWMTFDFVAERESIDEMAKIFDPDSLDLTAFKARGGKLIIVHGWGDAMITPNMTIDWFNNVKKVMGEANIGDFMQLYVVPGMDHGSGGSGPYVFDAITPLVKWVESGVAPSQLLLEDEPAVVPFRSRPVYPYPDFARYRGTGDPNAAGSFKRVAP